MVRENRQLRNARLYLFYLTFLLQFWATLQEDKQCKTEKVIVLIEGKSVQLVWENNDEEDEDNLEVVLSKPVCLDREDNVVYRICSNEQWIESTNKCHKTDKNQLCPPNFMENNKRCIFKTEPQTWNRVCPISGGFQPWKIELNDVWIPYKKTDSYGCYEYFLPGKSYGLRYSEDILNIPTESYFECLVLSNSKQVFESCNTKHAHVCSYNYDQFSYFCPDKCVPGGLGSNYCFCKVQRNTNGFDCKNFATPYYGYERKILENLADKDVCIIDNVQTNLSKPSYILNRRLHFGISKEGIILQNFEQYNCAICVTKALKPKASSLLLKSKEKQRKLYLTVYSPESLYVNEEDDYVYCFTNARNLKSRVEIDEVWNSYKTYGYQGEKTQVFEVSVEDYPGSYWCEGFQLPSMKKIVSNVIVAYKKFNGHEYSLRLRIQKMCRFSEEQCKNISISFITKVSEQLFKDKFFDKFVKAVRLFFIYSVDLLRENVDVLLHLTTETEISAVAEYYMIQRNLYRLMRKGTLVVYFKSSEFCFPDHTTSGSKNLYWKLSSIGIVRIPEELCVQENQMPVRRQCLGNFKFGAEWGSVEGTCSDNMTISLRTEILHHLRSADLSEDVSKNISTLTENGSHLTILDLYYVAELLTKIQTQYPKTIVNYFDDISDILNNLINSTSQATLKESQFHLNVTDEIIDTVENMLSSTNTSNNLMLLQRDNVVIHITKPFLNNISGIVLRGDSNKLFTDSKIENLDIMTNMDSLYDITDLEVATFVPNQLLQTLGINLTEQSKSEIMIITTIYYNDKFFNSPSNDSITSRVVSVSIPGYGEYCKEPIVVIFNRTDNGSHRCAFWNYGLNSLNYTGSWSILGGHLDRNGINSSNEGCFYSHLTNFALLVRTDPLWADEDELISFNITADKYHDKILTVISDTGCLLSLFGILGILITNLVFKSWREKVGTRILIQLCITILLQIIIINFANVKGDVLNYSKSYCTAVGIILHYIIIAEFSWMLVAAILQFFRFVQVIGPMPNRLFLKAMLVGWGLPFIPLVIVGLVDPQCYSAGLQGFCYPKGTSLYFGVLLPIAVIISANLAVFVLVIRNVFMLRIESQNNSNSILKRQLCLALLLFFLLGLPWLFGLLSEVIGHDSPISYFLVYLFCITATLQGFVLFIFYVVLDESTRNLWYKLIKKGLNRQLF